VPDFVPIQPLSVFPRHRFTSALSTAKYEKTTRPKMTSPQTKNGLQTLQDKTNLNKQKKETEKHFLF